VGTGIGPPFSAAFSRFMTSPGISHPGCSSVTQDMQDGGNEGFPQLKIQIAYRNRLKTGSQSAPELQQALPGSIFS
jgi:hypothetical protein